MEAAPQLLTEDIQAIEDPALKAVVELALKEAGETVSLGLTPDKCKEHIANRVGNALIAIIQKHTKD